MATARRKTSSRTPRKRTFYVKKSCRFCRKDTPRADYKDVETLRQYVTDRGKMLSRRITGVCARHQRALSREIKKARFIALLPFLED